MARVKITGATPEARQNARKKRTRDNRATYYTGRFDDAAGAPRRQLEVATHYLRAVGDDLTAPQMTQLARDVRDLAGRWDGNDGQ